MKCKRKKENPSTSFNSFLLSGQPDHTTNKRKKDIEMVRLAPRKRKDVKGSRRRQAVSHTYCPPINKEKRK
jgi:hypothetical protein